MVILENLESVKYFCKFFGYVKKNSIIKRENPKIGDSIWVTGNIGESHIGLLINKKKI